MIALALAACGPATENGPRKDRTSSTPTTPTVPTVPTYVTPPTLSASCEPEENTLRFLCTVEMDPAGPAEISFERADGTGSARTHYSAERLTSHDIGLYFMNPSTDYKWTASASEFPGVFVVGEVSTGIPPEGAALATEVEGESTADAFLLTSPCQGSGMPIVVDNQGELLWYDTLLTNAFIDSLIHTEEDTVMLQRSNTVLHETWMGEVLYRVSPGTNRLHHDIFRKDGLNYVLFEESILLHDRSYDLDGFYIFDDQGEVVAEWHLSDHFLPPDDPTLPANSIVDYSHANAVFVRDDGNVLLSFRHLSAFVLVNGDINDPDFGEILWRLTGDPDETEFGSDFTLTSSTVFSADFIRQHNVHQLPDGRYGLFDNRLSETARVSILSIDETNMTADVEQTWETAEMCRFQGSAWSTSAGNPVGHCAPEHYAQEFDIGGYPWAVFSLRVDCAVADSTYMPRMIPMDLY